MAERALDWFGMLGWRSAIGEAHVDLGTRRLPLRRHVALAHPVLRRLSGRGRE